MVGFDDYQGPLLTKRLFPIPPIYKSWKEKKSFMFTKLSSTAAYAVTIHKSQGLTFSKFVVDIDPKELSFGATYVAFSKVHLEGIVIKVYFGKEES